MVNTIYQNHENCDIYITSNPYALSRSKKHNKSTQNQLKSLNLKPKKIQGQSGHIRIRINADESMQEPELFLNARPLKDILS